ncbi:hypothetical protein DPEC_G00167660 [Dallia pectoralis]|uniref:Uncharacterized protein n=1 Tax=Dallia pectoralis TaxID=75939 RepID=A0ACC2GHP6_DALPE|nr:hypothetical protein DPEC_G00167660 [Dallia pectoralis]
MNGGKCFKIPSMDILTCVCNENYKGSRCEQYQLFSTARNDSGMIAAVVLIVLLILVVLAFIIYYIRKMLN